jgi:hypothetical protein
MYTLGTRLSKLFLLFLWIIIIYFETTKEFSASLLKIATLEMEGAWSSEAMV